MPRDKNRHRYRQLLTTGAAAWNSWREADGGTFYDLKDIDLWEMDLSNANFSDCDLTGASFHSTSLENADFSRAMINQVDFGSGRFHPAFIPSACLDGADLRGARAFRSRFSEASLRGARLDGATLWKSDFNEAVLSEATLVNADLRGADLRGADLEGADLTGANLQDASLVDANLRHVRLREANLTFATLVQCDLSFADLTGCRVYGVSAWDLNLDGAEQASLILTKESEPTVTIDELEVAQFLNLMLRNEKLRRLIDAVTSRAVLILGRFSVPRKRVLDAIRAELRRRGYVPVVFDFNRPATRDFVETVSTIAHMARFVVADMTDARIVVEEVPHIVRSTNVPLLPLLEGGTGAEPLTLSNLRINHRSLLNTVVYRSQKELISSFETSVLQPVERRLDELNERRRQELPEPPNDATTAT